MSPERHGDVFEGSEGDQRRVILIVHRQLLPQAISSTRGRENVSDSHPVELLGDDEGTDLVAVRPHISAGPPLQIGALQLEALHRARENP